MTIDVVTVDDIQNAKHDLEFKINELIREFNAKYKPAKVVNIKDAYGGVGKEEQLENPYKVITTIEIVCW